MSPGCNSSLSEKTILKNLIKKKLSLLKSSSWNDLHMEESSKDHLILIVCHAVYQITSDLCCKHPFFKSIWLAKAYSSQEAMQLYKSSHFIDTMLQSINQQKGSKSSNVLVIIHLSNLRYFPLHYGDTWSCMEQLVYLCRARSCKQCIQQHIMP